MPRSATPAQSPPIDPPAIVTAKWASACQFTTAPAWATGGCAGGLSLPDRAAPNLARELSMRRQRQRCSPPPQSWPKYSVAFRQDCHVDRPSDRLCLAHSHLHEECCQVDQHLGNLSQVLSRQRGDSPHEWLTVMSRYFINILGKFIFSLVDPLRSKVAPFGGRQSLHSLKLVLNVCL